MDIILLSNDTNESISPQYMPRPLKYNIFDIQHITNNKTCEVSLKLVACLNENDLTMLPTKYTGSMNANYDLNYLADQDGNVDENCTCAFINKINVQEQFSYLKCMENKIPFNSILQQIIDAISAANDPDLPLALLDKIKSITDEIKLHQSSLINENIYTIMDIESGTLTNQKNIKIELFQFNAESLSNGNQFIESYTVDCKKDGQNLDIEFKAKLLSLEVILQKISGNINPIDLGAECEANR